MLLEHRRPRIYVTGHFGGWEAVGYVMAVLGFPTTAVARPLDNPYVDRYIRDVRQASGLRILDKKGAGELAEELLGGNDSVSFIADQDAGRKGLFVDFFGRPASTFKSIALLAMRHQAPVIVAYGQRLGEDFQFEVGVQRIIWPEDWAGRDDPMRWITQEYTRALEDRIRQAPEQYLWAHRRWKHRPKGEPRPEDGIA
jgi:KDO2-lipid IV(A) lauroyltransferase